MYNKWTDGQTLNRCITFTVCTIIEILIKFGKTTNNIMTLVAAWRIVVSGVRRTNEVDVRRARLVHGWVTVFGRVYHLCMEQAN